MWKAWLAGISPLCYTPSHKLVAQLPRDITYCCANAGGTNAQYKSKARALLFNLRDSNNPQLRGRVLAGDIQPDALVQMTSEELASKVQALCMILTADDHCSAGSCQAGLRSPDAAIWCQTAATMALPAAHASRQPLLNV